MAYDSVLSILDSLLSYIEPLMDQMPNLAACTDNQQLEATSKLEIVR